MIDPHIVKNFPDTPGVYFFIGANKKILYIGKATSLRNRVRSYFLPNVMETRGPLITKMVRDAVLLEFKATDSVLEAILLEAELIKKFQPPANSKEKDDKSWNYVVVTKEDFPRVLLVRGRMLLFAGDTIKGVNIKEVFGPFPQGGLLREALKIVRKIFPFHDTCVPIADHTLKKSRPCFNRQIGLCPGVCTGEISKEEYAKTIRNITLFFRGKKRTLVKLLKVEMAEYAKRREFEKAERVKRTIFSLDHIHDVALMKRGYADDATSVTKGFRIEAYDIAHLSGTFVVGVMAVIFDGQAKKSDYRKFRIRRKAGVDDTGALFEIIDRRLSHDEWQMPDLIAVDGGVAHYNVAKAALKKHTAEILVVAVTKNKRHQPEKIVGDISSVKGHDADIYLANSEAHRFAIGYHKTLRSSGFTGSSAVGRAESGSGQTKSAFDREKSAHK